MSAALTALEPGKRLPHGRPLPAPQGVFPRYVEPEAASRGERLTMLIDSHCHLDFPDFAAEIDAVVERARAAGIGRMVSISTRVKKHAQILAIAEKYPDVFCSVGTHPHHADEEMDVTAADLVAIAKHSKVVAIGEAGLDYHYDTGSRDNQALSFRQHIAAARETGLPLVIHSREADADMARILVDETEKGAFPAVLHCFTGGRDLAFEAVELGLYIGFTGILTFKNGQDLRDIAQDLPAEPHSGRDRLAVSGAAAVSRQTQRAGIRGRDRQNAGAGARRRARGDRAADHRQFLPAVQQSAAYIGECRMTLKFTILGCGSSMGVPRVALGWGDCDPNEPKNRRRRCALLVEQAGAEGVTRVLVDCGPGSARAAASTPTSNGWTAF